MTGGYPHHRQDPFPDRLGQMGPSLNDDQEGNVDLSLAINAALRACFGVHLPPCGECAVLCAAWLRMVRFSRRLRYRFDSTWYSVILLGNAFENT